MFERSHTWRSGGSGLECVNFRGHSLAIIFGGDMVKNEHCFLEICSVLSAELPWQ